MKLFRLLWPWEDPQAIPMRDGGSSLAPRKLEVSHGEKGLETFLTQIGMCQPRNIQRDRLQRAGMHFTAHNGEHVIVASLSQQSERLYFNLTAMDFHWHFFLLLVLPCAWCTEGICQSLCIPAFSQQMAVLPCNLSLHIPARSRHAHH